jgi:hypothetical protein
MFTSIIGRESKEWNAPIVLCSTDIYFNFGVFNYIRNFIFDVMLTQQLPDLDSFVRTFYTNIVIVDNFTTELSLIINTCWLS